MGKAEIGNARGLLEYSCRRLESKESVDLSFAGWALDLREVKVVVPRLVWKNRQTRPLPAPWELGACLVVMSNEAPIVVAGHAVRHVDLVSVSPGVTATAMNWAMRSKRDEHPQKPTQRDTCSPYVRKPSLPRLGTTWGRPHAFL